MKNVPLSIETYFYNKLVGQELFGQPKEGLLDALKGRISSGTDEQFDAAAEIIIRERKSGAFPSLPVCIEAIERAGQGVTKGARHQPASGAVTRENYHKLASGRASLVTRDDPMAWREWRAYFRWLGLHAAYSEMSNPARREWTVPAGLPGQFDPAFRGVEIEDEEQSKPVSAERRREIVARYEQQVSTMRAKYGGQVKRAAPPVDPMAELIETAEAYRASPCDVSPELAALVCGGKARNAA